jgi:hypothetical protein
VSIVTRSVRWLGVAGVGLAASPSIYLGGLTALAARPHRCGRSTAPRFAVVVPAHNEAANIIATLDSVDQLRYPADRLSIVVVADNCTDDTAEIARSHGAAVIERFDDRNRGKGFALSTAFGQLLSDPRHDAFVVIDADSIVGPDLLERAADHLDRGDQAIQVFYRIRNPEASWRTRLLDVAFTCKHRIRARGHGAIGGTVGLCGNGMVFSRAVLETMPYTAYSVVEDIEYGMMLASAGIAVKPCDATWVAGDMPTTADDSTSQRLRWELGNSIIKRTYGWPALRRGMLRRDRIQVDAALDVVVPSIATVATVLTGATVVAAIASSAALPGGRIIVAVGWVGLIGHLIAGTAASTSRWQAIPALAKAPGYVLWKASLRCSRAWREEAASGPTWSRTARSVTAGLDQGNEVVFA